MENNPTLDAIERLIGIILPNLYMFRPSPYCLYLGDGNTPPFRVVVQDNADFTWRVFTVNYYTGDVETLYRGADRTEVVRYILIHARQIA